MKWDGTSSDETKKQLYSIIERFMLKYPDPDSKLLDKELRGAGHTKEECYLNMRYILGDHPGRSDGSYSKEDKKFVEYLSKKLSNEIIIAKTTEKTAATDNESRSDVGKERVQAWSAGKNDRKLYLEEVERESTYGLSDSDETVRSLKRRATNTGRS